MSCPVRGKDNSLTKLIKIGVKLGNNGNLLLNLLTKLDDVQNCTSPSYPEMPSIFRKKNSLQPKITVYGAEDTR